MPDRVVVTGGAGFIGSHLVDALVARGDDVIVIDNLATGSRENIAHLLPDKITFVEGDITNLDLLHKHFKGARYVFHQAALGSVPHSVDDPVAAHAVNVNGTLNVLLAAKEAGVEKVVYASSSSVYGDVDAPANHEGLKPSPKSPYAASKLAAEHYCQVFNEAYRVGVVVLRCFNVFGPRQNPESQYAAVVPKFITAMLRGEQPVVFGDGASSRDFIFAENVVQANLLAAGQGPSGVYNIAAGSPITLNELVAALNRAFGTNIKPKYTDPRPGDIAYSKADISKAREYLGYDVAVPFEEGIKRTVEWYKQRYGQAEVKKSVSFSAWGGEKRGEARTPVVPGTAVLQDKKVGVVGYGYVGKIVEKFFADRYEVRVYDPAYNGRNKREAINECDLAVVCVPTPMREDGTCDTSIVEEVIGWVEAPLILIRSTIPPGTVDRLKKETGKHIVFSPEYSGESKYWSPYPFDKDERAVPFYTFGGDAEDCQGIIDLYVPITGPTKQYRITTAKIAETVKHFENEYFAWKVMWANEMRETCEAIGVPYWEVRDVWSLDPRVDRMHTAVFADNRGFGGKCLPKDTLSLLRWAKQAGYEKRILKAIIERNLELRKGRGEYPEQFRL